MPTGQPPAWLEPHAHTIANIEMDRLIGWWIKILEVRIRVLVGSSNIDSDSLEIATDRLPLGKLMKDLLLLDSRPTPCQDDQSTNWLSEQQTEG